MVLKMGSHLEVEYGRCGQSAEQPQDLPSQRACGNRRRWGAWCLMFSASVGQDTGKDSSLRLRVGEAEDPLDKLARKLITG